MQIEQRDAMLLPADSLAMALPEIRLEAAVARALQNGQTPHIPLTPNSIPLMDFAEYRAYDDKNMFLGVATASHCDSHGATLTALRLMAPSAVASQNP